MKLQWRRCQEYNLHQIKQEYHITSGFVNNHREIYQTAEVNLKKKGGAGGQDEVGRGVTGFITESDMSTANAYILV